MPSFRRPRVAPTGGSGVRTVGRGVAVALIVVWALSGNRAAARPAWAPAPAAQNAAPASTPAASASASFTIYLRTSPIGNETVSVARTADGWTITSSGRAVVPIDVVTRQVKMRYTTDWKPVDVSIDATLRGEVIVAHTAVEGATARTVMTQGGRTVEQSEPIADDAVMLPAVLWGPFEALARRLANAPAGSSIQAFAPGASFPVRVGASANETLQTGTRTIRARRTAVTLTAAGAPVAAEIWADENGRLMRVSIPAQNLEVVRDDIASVSVRRVLFSRAGDQEIRVPANGFRLAGTLSKPPHAGTGLLPVVILAGGAGLTDRDETTYGVPIFGQLSGMLADAGFLVVRYDRRAIGQSGGRAESATITDYTDDLIAVVDAVRRLPGVDRKRIAVAGHGDGGTVSMLAASRKKDIAALILIEAMATTGAELNMWQASRGVERSTRSPEEKASTIDLQRRIQAAVLTGTGWDTIAPGFRQAADTPWFKSFLLFDPARVVSRISQPLLIVHGMLDTQVPPSSADVLEALARLRKNRSVDVVKLPGVNHLLTHAVTGETGEYANLTDKHVSPAVAAAMVDWLKTTFSRVR